MKNILSIFISILFSSATFCQDGQIMIDCDSILKYRKIKLDCLPQEESREIFKIAENKPIFKSCEGKGNERLNDECTVKTLRNFVREFIAEKKKEKELSGKIAALITIEKDGCISEIIFPKSYEINCEQIETTIELISALPEWVPGKQRGRPIAHQYGLTIDFGK